MSYDITFSCFNQNRYDDVASSWKDSLVSGRLKQTYLLI
jgi:hypothetical protein